jgi:hypothetical protein
MKKKVRFLLKRAVNSLILSIELFNRPSDQGRVDGVLIFLDHSFEMLLKAAILHRGGRLEHPDRENQTIGFEACVRKALSEGSVKFITDEQAITLQTVNALRDAAQHDLVELPEQVFYVQVQAGLTLFRDLYRAIFSRELRTELPARVLPLSTLAPTDLATMFDAEVREIERLLRPGLRRRTEAKLRLTGLAIIDQAVQGTAGQASDRRLNAIVKGMQEGRSWEDIFPGVAALDLTTQGYGPSIDLRIVKKAGVPISLVKEGTEGATVVAIKRTDELGYYNLGRDQLAANVGLTPPKTTAVIRFLNLREDPACFKQIMVGKVPFDRYSQLAIKRIRETLATTSIDAIWESHGIRPRKTE